MGSNFATPIAHQAGANYAAFTNALAVGRPFRQPLQTAANPADFSPGLELFLSNTGDVPVIFCWLDGKLTFERLTLGGTVAVTNASPTVTGTNTTWDATLEGRTLQVGAGTDGFLIVKVDSATELTLARNFTGANATGQAYTVTPSQRLALQTERTGGVTQVRMIEALPKSAFYENVDQVSVQTALETLLNNAHTHASTHAQQTWHRSMRMRVGTPPRTLKAHIDASGGTAEVTRLVTGLLTGAAGALLQSGLDVAAGDAIGRAAAYLATDTLPASPPFALGAAADANRARRLTFRVQDIGGQTMDPVYYLHLFMRQMLLTGNARKVTSLTNVVAGGVPTHPLVTLFPAISTAAAPRARAQVNGQTRIPLGRLANFHGHPDPNPVSQREWHYTDDSVFEARPRGSTTLVNLSPTAANQTSVNTLWTTEGAALAPICELLQVPCELMFFFAGAETGNNPRLTRLEPLKPDNRIALQNAGVSAALELAYDHATGDEGTLTNVVLNANNTSLVTVTLNQAKAIRQNLLTRVSGSVLVDDVERLKITNQNTFSTTPIAAYDLTVNDTKMKGGFVAGTPQPVGVTLFYPPTARAAGVAGHNAAARPAIRDGTVRRLSVTAAANTLDGNTIVTVFHNAVATPLTLTLAPGGTNGSNNTDTFAVPSGGTISIRVETAGTTGDIRNLKWELQSAPVVNATAWILEGTERAVPNPWNGAGIVRSTLTWDDLITIVNGTGGARISPGLMQNLISSAMHSVKFLGIDATHTTAAGLPALPATAGGYLNDWLLAPARSIFIAGAELRANYKSDETFFDLPLAACAYNTGRVAVRNPSPWGLIVDDAYVPRGAPFFNAAATLFNGPAPATAPSVRFMR